MIIEDVQILVRHQRLNLYQKVPFQSIWKSKYFGDQVKLSDTLVKSKIILYLLFCNCNTDYHLPQLLPYLSQRTTISLERISSIERQFGFPSLLDNLTTPTLRSLLWPKQSTTMHSLCRDVIEIWTSPSERPWLFMPRSLFLLGHQQRMFHHPPTKRYCISTKFYFL